MDALPTPFYERDGITIYHGDCLSVLPQIATASLDITITSPPYNTLPQKNKPSGLHGQRRSGVNKWIKKAVNGYADHHPEAVYQAWLNHVLVECARCCKGLLWVNHKVRYRDGAAVHPVRFIPFPIYAEVIWDRHGSMALNCKRYAPSHEALWAFGEPHWWNDDQNGLLSVWRLGFDRDDNDHPCAFPLSIAQRPLESSCPPDGIALDPFTGSGTTAVACILAGRRFVGIEKNRGYCEGAVKRIEAAFRARDLGTTAQIDIDFSDPAPAGKEGQ
jgi:DNA modification methylase